MSTPESGAPQGQVEVSPAASTAVKLVSGQLSNDELAAIAVAVSALSVVAREEAHQRELESRSGDRGTGWSSPVHRVRGGHALRGERGPMAWRFNHR
ncbi:hypothetical protein M3A96_05145 [Helcobacillus massiliensis]|uniref:Uncharacterized protein n=1 Tax=Helcobacillus massiliensis TaxID=521392 RepID=A0A839QNR9_9MICO|nr:MULTISPECIES: hypothetical protein [Helcobacillus]MBB3021944.1 hypothetical protein [Helcobacillus massiliensis]MCG7427495.1 hypothetical protein [Helcobacillus sp. ACRRO]MCT1557501.1 hypothetical protein [Helcobacillus massiliensis]MCT2036318.1 hypothetical protein [Helcobacillus massiliensis]MCT2331940.1 hypothetical protein [Helcobacillus massiliensis]